MTIRSGSFLFLTAVCGVGIAVFSKIDDGMYSAVFLFLLPIFVAFSSISVISDLGKESRTLAVETASSIDPNPISEPEARPSARSHAA